MLLVLMLDLVGGGTSQVLARIEQLPFEDNKFSVVLSLGNVFDQLIYNQDHDLMMREIHRVLKPKGFYLGYGFAKIKAWPIEGFVLLLQPGAGDDFTYRHLYQKS